MSKKDCIKFAMLIAKYRSESVSAGMPQSVLDTIESMQLDMINIFESDNPSFDADRFNQFVNDEVKKILD